MKQYDNEKADKMEKVVKNALFIFPFLLNNEFLSELSDLENAGEIFVK